MIRSSDWVRDRLKKPDAPTLRQRIMSSLAVRREIERNVSGIVALVVIPAIFGLLGAYSERLQEALGRGGVTWCWLVAILLLGFFAVRLHLPERSVHALLVDNEELASEKAALAKGIKQLEAAIELLALQVNYCESMRGVTLAHSRSDVRTRERLVAAINDVCATIYLRTEEFFGCGASEKWSFAVYLWSERSQRLLPIWRYAAPNHPARGNPRIWGRGEGHVGKAFVDRKPIITGNASLAEVADFSAVPPGMEQPWDGSAYQSFASLPIGPILKEDGRPYGVLVGTSDRPGRFDRENTAILAQAAGVLASLLISGNLDVDDVATIGADGSLEDVHGR